MTEEIKLNVIGKILEGDDMGSYVLIEDDFENTGGYLILVHKDLSCASGKGSDYWVETLKNLEGFFQESNWKIQWLQRGIQPEPISD